jgi:flagellar motor switch protein FliN/FliY
LLRQASASAAGAHDEASSSAPDSKEGSSDTPTESEKPSAEKASAQQPAAEQAAASSPAPAAADADVEFLLNQAEEAIRSVDQPQENTPEGLTPFQLQQLGSVAASGDRASLDLLRDVELDLRIELGRTHMYLEDVLQLRKGSVVPLDKLAGDPVDIFVNGRLVARGEVLVLNDNFCVRIAELISGEEFE